MNDIIERALWTAAEVLLVGVIGLLVSLATRWSEAGAFVFDNALLVGVGSIVVASVAAGLSVIKTFIVNKLEAS